MRRDEKGGMPRNFNPYPFEYHRELELRIDSLSNEGEGVGRVNGWVVFVPFSLPGELVRARVYRNEKNCSRADMVQVLETSAYRVQPICPLFGLCGGCCYQHLCYAQQLAWKRTQIRELLRLRAGFDVPVSPVVPSPRLLAYRSKITPHFHRPKQGEMGCIGFLRAGSRSEVCDVAQCPIAMEEINKVLPELRRQVHAAAARYRRGATLLMRVSEGSVLTNPRAVCTETVGKLKFSFLAGDFFQNNPFILPTFAGYVIQQAAGGGVHYLVDAYCGSGLFSLCASPQFREIAGVEVSESSVDWARANAVANGVTNARFQAAEAAAIFGEIAFPADETTVLVDPPRKGCDKVFLEQLFAYGPRRVVYVSCNPATQVRDLADFRAHGYTVGEVQPFDLFPQTKHTECVTTIYRQS